MEDWNFELDWFDAFENAKIIYKTSTGFLIIPYPKLGGMCFDKSQLCRIKLQRERFKVCLVKCGKILCIFCPNYFYICFATSLLRVEGDRHFDSSNFVC